MSKSDTDNTDIESLDSQNNQQKELKPLKQLLTALKNSIDKLRGQIRDVDTKDPDGTTALIAAAEIGDAKIIQRLFAKGANPNLTNNNNASALIIAASKGHKKVVKKLLSHPDIDLNIRDKVGKTALITAIDEKQRNIARLLINQPTIQLSLKDTRGRTALEAAEIGGLKNIANILSNKLLNPSKKEPIITHLEDHYAAPLNKYKYHEKKPSGISTGFTGQKNGTNYMLKSSNTSEEEATDFTMEYIFAPLFKRILFNQSPIIGLATEANNIHLKSKFLENFQTIFDARKTKRAIPLNGIEKVLATSIFLGDHDYHTENLGIITKNIINTTGKQATVTQVAKIDHGKSGFFNKNLTASDIRQELLDASDEFNYPLNFDQLLSAVKTINEIPSEEIANITRNRVTTLKSSKFQLPDYSTNFPPKYNYFTAKIPRNSTQHSKSNEKIKYQKLEEFLIHNLNEQKKAFLELETSLEIINKIDSPNESKITLLRQIKEKDPIIWARNNNKTISGQDPIIWALDNDKKIDGQDPFSWALKRNIKVDGQDPLSWALDNNKKMNGDDPIIWAAKNNNVEFIKILVQNKADINKADENGITALMTAAHMGLKNNVQQLLDARANINAQDNNGLTPLLHALYENKLHSVELLLNAGADLNIKDKDGNSALTLIETEKFKKGGEIESIKIYPKIKSLFKKQTLPPPSPFIKPSNNNETVDKIVQALEDNNEIFIDQLIKRGEVNKTYQGGLTALMLAVYLGKTDITQKLLDAKADVNAQNAYGFTPLLHALYENDINSVALLLRAGADITIKDNYGNSALTVLNTGRFTENETKVDIEIKQEIKSLIEAAKQKKSLELATLEIAQGIKSIISYDDSKVNYIGSGKASARSRSTKASREI